jgi:hypothetical protein
MATNPVYFGLSVDMDRAYNSFKNTHGRFIPEKHPQHLKYTQMENEFVSGTQEIIKWLEINKLQNSVTWFVNEAAYKISCNFPELLLQCSQMGECGIHTHFNSTTFHGDEDKMTENPEDWFQEGILAPKKTLENFIGKKINSFKSGNHMRNDMMFEKLMEAGFTVDCTKVFEEVHIEQQKIYFNDADIKLGTSPWFIEHKNKNQRLLEIPEIVPTEQSLMAHLNKINHRDPNEPIFFRFQTHPWQVELLELFTKLINFLKLKCKNFKVATLDKMMDIHTDYQLSLLNNKIINLCQLDHKNLGNYYLNRIKAEKIIDNNDRYVLKYLQKYFPLNTKILELFAGIGQSASILGLLGFKDVHMLEFELDRCQYAKYLNQKLELKTQIIQQDFFTFGDEILKYDLIFSVNADATCLGNNLEQQYKIYTDFMKNKKHQMLFNIDIYSNHNKYQSKISEHKNRHVMDQIMDKIDQKILDFSYEILEKGFVLFYYRDEKDFRLQQQNINSTISRYKLIRPKKLLLNVTEENKEQIAKVTYWDNENTNGLFFELTYEFFKKHHFKLPSQSYQLSFQCKLEKKYPKDIVLRFYNGKEYLPFESLLTDQYQNYEYRGMIYFSNRSSPRINIFNPMENLVFYLKNPIFIDSVDDKECEVNIKSAFVEYMQLHHPLQINELPIQGLWIGSSNQQSLITGDLNSASSKTTQSFGNELSVMEQLCIRSFLKNGHQFILYTYGEVKNVPQGTIIKNGNEILSQDKIFTYSEKADTKGISKGSYAGFSNTFRYKMLDENGGYWVDMDMICLKHLDFKDDYVFSSERGSDGSQKTNCGLVKVPKKSELMKYLFETADAKKTEELKWGEIGPRLMDAGIKKYGLEKYIHPPEEFCPISYHHVNQIF